MSVRVLIVDDSAVVRRILGDALAVESDFVITTARNGRHGLELLADARPDVVVLDVEMPELDGLATLREMRTRNINVPVVMFSSLTAAGSAATVEALSLGAADYVTKPTGAGSLVSSIEQIREQLVPRIRALAGRRGTAPVVVPVARRPVTPREANRRTGIDPIVQAVMIGISTGGPQALATVIPALPADLRVPICIVQHMPPTFTAHLARRLDGLSPLDVREAAGGERLEAGHVYIAPGDHHLLVERADGGVFTRLNDGPTENSCRPAVDPLFRAAASVWADGVLAVVLTGMGYDGRNGATAVREAGGRVLAQDEASSVVWGMPGAVVGAGLADSVIPLDGVAAEITRRVQARQPLKTREAVR